MDLWVIWLVLAVMFAVGEMLTTSFYLAPFAGGALLATAVDAAGLPAGVSIATFVVGSVVLLTTLRPVARRHMTTPARLRTGTDALVGRPAVVLEAISNDAATGTVRLNGDVWTARSYMEDEELAAGTRVQVIEIKGATALVSE